MLKNLFAVFIVLASVLSLGLKFTANGKALEVEGPGVLHTTPSGDLSVQLGSELWIIDKDNIHKTTVSFAKNSEQLNIKGDYEFFSNGDLLVHSSQTEQTISDNFTSFLRNQQKDIELSTANEGLYRCDSSGQNCRLFANSFAKLGPVFRLSVDRITDTVYLSDTSRFILYKFDSTGVMLATQNQGLEFPNQIVFDNDALFVANTNHNGVTKVETKTNLFGEKIKHYTTRIDSSHIWPAQLTKVENDWWVTLANSGMEDAAIQVYDENFEPVRTLLQAPNADPISITYFNNAIWASDLTNFSFTRYARNGESIETQLPASLNERLSTTKSEHDHFEMLSSVGHWLFIGVLGFGVIAAYFIEKKTTINTLTGRTKDEDTTIGEKTLAPDNTGVIWYENKLRKILPVFFYVTVLITAFLVIWSVLGLMSEQTESHIIASMQLLTSATFVVLYRICRIAFRNRIGISGDILLAEDFNGKVAAVPASAISVYYNRLLVNDVVVATGTNLDKYSFYSDTSFKHTVMPKITTAQKVGHIEYLSKLWENYRPLMLEYMLLTVASLLLPLLL